MNALLIDIGNSRVKARVAALDPAAGADDDSGWDSATHAVDATRAERIVDDVAVAVDLVVVSNVASEVRGEAVTRAVAERWPRARIERVVAQRQQCGVVNGYHEPAMLGADRWMALLGAHVRHPAWSALVCSFGTATTIDLLVTPDPAGGKPARFVGGLILPGLEAMRTVLSATTARLPLAGGEARDFAERTDDAIRSGVLAAQAGAVERACRLARQRLDIDASAAPLRVIATGGNAASVTAALQALDTPIVAVPDLVLHGLRTVAFRSAASSAGHHAPATSC